MAMSTTRISRRRDTTGFVDALEKILRDDAFERFGKRGANLVLLIRRENVDDAVDRLGRARSMQGAEDKVTGGGRGQRQLDRFMIAHFTDEQDIRIFTERAAQCSRERARVNADFAMLHETILAAMHKFDRIFDRDDVVVPLQVRVIHHRRERGRLARTGRPGHEHESLFEQRKFFQDRRKTQLLDRQHLRRNRDGRPPRCRISAGKNSRDNGPDARNFVTEIDVGCFFEDLDLPFRRDLVDHRLEIVVFERRVIDTHQVAIDAEHGRIV